MKLRILVFLSICTNLLYGQETPEVHKHADHGSHKNEIGLSYGIHLHYLHNLKESRFAVGLGFEKIFDEHKHNTFGLIGSYRPIDRLSVHVSPGLTYEGDKFSDPFFAFHLETTYEFNIENFHIDPALEFAWDPEDIHISLGLHWGIGF